MVHEMAPERRLGALGKMARRKRIFARLREGASYEEIAGEESVSRERIRQIVSEVLQKRAVDSGADHAKLQLDRLTPVMQLAAEAIAAGDVSGHYALFEGARSARPLSDGRRRPPSL